MNLFHETFSTGQVVVASGVSNATLQSWLKRDVVIGQAKNNGPSDEVTGAGSPGSHRRFSFRNVIQIALAKVILDTSALSVQQAFFAAGMYAHIGDTEPIERIPGLPYKGSVLTLLCVSGDLCNVYAYKPGADPYPSIRYFLGKPEGFSLVEVNSVFDRVTSSLGYKPHDILAAVYLPEAGQK